MIALFAVALFACAACSSPIGDDADEPTPPQITTPTEARASATSAEQSTRIDTPDDATPSPRAELATATVTIPPSTTARPSTTADVTPTDEPLPSDGDQLLIDGDLITRIVAGNDRGSTLYATTSSSLWRSDDGGLQWTEAGAADLAPLIVALNDSDVLYTGDRGGCGRGFSFFAFERSRDAGDTWETLDSIPDMEPFLAYESRDAAYLYGSNCGLSVSADGGESWAAVPDLNGEEIFAVATDRSDPMAQIIVSAATEGSTGRLFLFDTDDPGRPQFVRPLIQYWAKAALDWSDGRMVVAHSHLVGVSDDGGETWSWSRKGLEETTFSVDPLFEARPEYELDSIRQIDIVRIDPTDRDRIWLGSSQGAFLSVDGGQTWERVGDAVAITGIALVPHSDRAFISSATGTRLWTLDER